VHCVLTAQESRLAADGKTPAKSALGGEERAMTDRQEWTDNWHLEWTQGGYSLCCRPLIWHSAGLFRRLVRPDTRRPDMDQMKSRLSQMCSSSNVLEHPCRWVGALPLRHREEAGRVVVPHQVVQGDVSGCAPGASKVTFPLDEIVPNETRC
jgi:hypothetical protein